MPTEAGRRFVSSLRVANTVSVWTGFMVLIACVLGMAARAISLRQRDI